MYDNSKKNGGYKPWKNYENNQRKDLQKYAETTRNDVAEKKELLKMLASYESQIKRGDSTGDVRDISGIDDIRKVLREDLEESKDSGEFKTHFTKSARSKEQTKGLGHFDFPNPKHPDNKITTHLNNQEHINNLRIKKNLYNHRSAGH
jgi:hypothetical protein